MNQLRSNLVSEIVNLDDGILVAGAGIVAMDAIQLLQTRTNKPIFFATPSSKMSRLNRVKINGVIDSTFEDSVGFGGMTKFWERQLMRMEEIHFQKRGWLGFEGVDIFRQYEDLTSQTEQDYDLVSFESMKKMKPIITLKNLAEVRSQFMSEAALQKLFNGVRSSNATELSDIKILHFEEVDSRLVVTGMRPDNSLITIYCGMLFLASGTVENTAIVLRSREIDQGRFRTDSPIGYSLVDHPIIQLGLFKSKGIFHKRFPVNQINIDSKRFKLKYSVSAISQKAANVSDCLIEFSPVVKPIQNTAWFLRKLDSTLNTLFIKFGIDLRYGTKFLEVQLHLEKSSSPNNRIQINKNSLDVDLVITDSEIDLKSMNFYTSLVEEFLEKSGYSRESTTFKIDSGYHFGGTLKMGVDPGKSVVGTDGRLHGFKSVFSLGLANFETTGFTNPTFSALVLNRIILNNLNFEDEVL